MGVSYDASAIIGIAFTEEQIDAAFGRNLPEWSHEEERFDPRTGKSLGMVKIVTKPARRLLVLDDEIYDQDSLTLMQDLARHIGCDMDWAGDFRGGEGLYVLGSSVPDGASLEDVARLMNAAAELQGPIRLAFSHRPEMELDQVRFHVLMRIG